MRRLIALIAVAACHKDTAPPPIVKAADAAAPLDAPTPPPDAPEAARPTATKLVAAGDSTCALMSDTTVRCWGNNDHGQLGDGTTNDSSRPLRPAIRSVKDLIVADGTACALLDDRSVSCWGQIDWQGSGQDVLRPTGVMSVTGVKQLFVFPRRACARVASDDLVCWGEIDARGRFAKVPGKRRVTVVDGMEHVRELSPTAAVRDDGSVWSWAGEGRPTRRGLDDVKQLGEREGAICGLLGSGDVACVASSLPCVPAPAPVAPTPVPKPTKKASRPPRGKRPTALKRAPAPPIAETKPVEPSVTLTLPKARSLVFDAGWCVVTSGGVVQCGDGCSKPDAPWRRLDKIEEVVAHCARSKGGSVTCWDPAKPRPAPIEGITGATALAVGRIHGCAIVAGGGITCWGDNTHGQLGRGDRAAHRDAAAVTP